MMFKKIGFFFALLGLLAAAGCGPATPTPTPTPEPEPLRVVVPPNPNAIPLFVMLAQEPDVPVKVIPVPGVPELVAAVRGEDADVALFFSAAGAKLYNQGKLPPLQLVNVNVWRALYLVAPPGVTSLADLQGKTILASFQGGAPDLVMRAVMRQQGYDPDKDFNLEYLPPAQVKQLMLAGKGAAALLPEPQATVLVLKARQEGLDLRPVIDLQTGFGSDAWQEGLAPLGGVFVAQKTLNDPARKALFDAFVAAYGRAADYAMTHPDEAAALASQGFADYFGTQLPAQGIAQALRTRTLTLESRPVADLRPALDDFLAQIVGKAPDDGFYAP